MCLKHTGLVMCTMKQNSEEMFIVTAGSSYLDIDAYACCVAMQELLVLQGKNATTYSSAMFNYSIPQYIAELGQINRSLPKEIEKSKVRYIIVDVSDPNYIDNDISISDIIAVYDHHIGYEDYWNEKIGSSNTHIEFIGAAATLIYRLFVSYNLQDQMSKSTAKLLIAAILDNTLNLSSGNTTNEDRQTLFNLCRKAEVDSEWCAHYFCEVQKQIEYDMKNAIFGDIKCIKQSEFLPDRIAQLSVWDAIKILDKLSDIRKWFGESHNTWLLNIIDIQRHCSFFVCDNKYYQKKLEIAFDCTFIDDFAQLSAPYLRKEIIKNMIGNR